MSDCHTFDAPPTGPVYQQLVEFGSSVASKALLVVRDPEIEPGVSIRSQLAILRPFLRAAVPAREWPGTILLGSETATLYEYAPSPELCRALTSLHSALFDWIHPGAPEDLCFCRGDGTPILVTTSHEGDAYVLLSRQEKIIIDHSFPALAAALVREPE
jgi:hypothetical protein